MSTNVTMVGPVWECGNRFLSGSAILLFQGIENVVLVYVKRGVYGADLSEFESIAKDAQKEFDQRLGQALVRGPD